MIEAEIEAVALALAALKAMMELPTANPRTLTAGGRRQRWATHAQARAAIAALEKLRP